MSGRFPEPTRRDHQSFCLVEEWDEVRTTRGKVGHHVTYELTLPDGRVLRTRISHPPGRQTYGKSLWAHVLRDQLEVTETEFWACARERTPPVRGPLAEHAGAIPAGVVSQLLANGVDEAEIRGMSKAEAIDRLNQIWSSS